MQETFIKYRDKIIEYWKGLQRSRKITIAVIALAVVVILVLLVRNATKVEYAVLYSGLNLQDQSKITKALDELSVPYTLQGNSTILVPKDRVDKTRIDLAGQNLPSAGYDYDKMFQDTSWSQTSFDKNVRLQRLKEATLEKTIKSIEGITDATVMLEMPDNSNFVLSEQEVLPTASVYINWDGGGTKRNEIVKAIQNLVAHSTVKLKQDNVSVTDNYGDVLSKVSGEDSVSTESYARARTLASTYEQKIRNMLETIVGKNNANVIVNVDLDMDLEKEVEKIYNPPIEGEEGGLVRSQELLNEEAKGQGAEGAPGTESNVEDDVLQNGGGSTYKKNQSTTNYELNERQTEVRKTPGQIKEVTVSVVLNRKVLPGEELTDELKEDYINMVKASVGSKVKTVSVTAQEFAEKSDPNAQEESPGVVQKYWWIGAIVLILLSALIVFLILRHKKKKREEEELKALLAEEERQRRLQQQQQEEEDEESLEFETEDSKMKRQIDMFIEQNPEAVVQLLRNWLNE